MRARYAVGHRCRTVGGEAPRKVFDDLAAGDLASDDETMTRIAPEYRGWWRITATSQCSDCGVEFLGPPVEGDPRALRTAEAEEDFDLVGPRAATTPVAEVLNG